MSVDVIKYAGVAGEISPSFLGRSDLEKYDLGVAQLQNFFVDYRGGLSNRPGTELVDFVQKDWKETRFIPFRFASDVLTTYNILFGDGYIRFIQDGAYVLEAAKTITGITQASPGVVTAVGHGFSAGDLIKIFDVVGMTELNAQTFVVGTVTTDTFQLKRLDEAVSNFDTTNLSTYTSGGHAYRVYTLVSPYTDTDLDTLRARQTRSIVRLTHPSYPAKTLTRISDTNWTLADVSLGATIAAPTGLSISPSASGSAGMAFAVTAVDKDGQESVVSVYAFNTASVDYTTTAGSATLTWTAVAGAKFYNVYRSQIIPNGTAVNRAMEVGFLGIAFGPTFVDNNVIPDFTITPPTHDDPFANGAITQVDVTAGGSGYTNASVVSASGGGSGFVGYPVVNGSGAITAIVIVHGGSGYATPTISATVGTGATFTVTTSPTSGNYPRVSTIFQQREVYAGSINNPLTIDASRPGQLNVFDVSSVVKDDDAYEFDLDSEQADPIQDLIPTRAGLVVLTEAGIWNLTGDTQLAVTPTNAVASPQSNTGADNLQPLIIDTDLLYVESEGVTVRLLSYNDFTKIFAGQDMSILASHLLAPDNQIEQWTFAANPYKMVYGVRTDGVCLSLALVKEQNVYGWSRLMTQGRYVDVLNLQEGNVDSVYFMVQRYIDGRWGKTIERQHSRRFMNAEDAWFVDCGLSLGSTSPNAEIVIPDDDRGNTVTVVASAAVFASGDVGKILRAAGGRLKVESFVDSTHVTAKFLRVMTDLVPLLSEARVKSGKWTLDAEVSSVFLGYPYEGMTVKIVADGNVLPDQVVTDGAVTLPAPASMVICGFGYRSLIQTLPPTMSSATIEGDLKRPLGVKLRLQDTRGIKLGADLDHLMPIKNVQGPTWGEAAPLMNGLTDQTIPASRFDLNGQFYFVSDDPLPVTVLGFVTKLDVSDAND